MIVLMRKMIASQNRFKCVKFLACALSQHFVGSQELNSYIIFELYLEFILSLGDENLALAELLHVNN